jgi:zinc D-Ala-D-Ala carboxypeptidase
MTNYTEETYPADRWPNFSFNELACQETGKLRLNDRAMDDLQAMRTYTDFPFIITSGYRAPEHSIEQAKAAPGTHTLGLAFDIACHGSQASRIMITAYRYGFLGMGFHQKGDLTSRYIHIDQAPSAPKHPRPTVWTY